MSKKCGGDISEKGQFKRSNILIPFLDYKFKKSSIKHMMINPVIKKENNIFELGIKELLWWNRMEDVSSALLIFRLENIVNNKMDGWIF